MSTLGGMVGIKAERSERQSDRVEHHHPNGLYVGRFDVEKVRFFTKTVAMIPVTDKITACFAKSCLVIGRQKVAFK